MKVIFINSLFYPLEIGGAEKSLRNLVRALQQHHRIVPVVITLNDKSASDDIVETLDDITIYRLGYRNTRFIFGASASLVRRAAWHLKDYDNKEFDAVIDGILHSERPDLVHTNNLLGFSARPIHLAQKRGIPVMHTIRDYYLQCWKSCKFSNGKNCEKQCVSCAIVSQKRKSYSNLVSCVIGNSSFILENHLAAGVFHLTPTKGVIYNIYEPDGHPEHRNKTIGDGITLGYMGRLNREKGIRELIDLVKGVSGFRLIVAGSGDLADYARAVANEHGNIRYVGYAEPKELTDLIDILVVPSLWHEPLSRTIFESYSYGVPVIGSACGGTPEIIEPGVTGAIFDPADFNEIFSLAKSICTTPQVYEAISKNCLTYSRQFSRRAIAGAYHETYERVLAGSR